jgi:hypothetical protein
MEKPTVNLSTYFSSSSRFQHVKERYRSGEPLSGRKSYIFLIGSISLEFPSYLDKNIPKSINITTKIITGIIKSKKIRKKGIAFSNDKEKPIYQ